MSPPRRRRFPSITYPSPIPSQQHYKADDTAHGSQSNSPSTFSRRSGNTTSPDDSGRNGSLMEWPLADNQTARGFYQENKEEAADINGQRVGFDNVKRECFNCLKT
ncbi:hypothetical protein Tco_0096772 [Tanacetum coccineum]|uniref:Uncharacterized protein n=1 Tax=Tanacetum coccineum TaxID=301880 RepID=A0ABQ5AVZ3_9ASTR